MANQLEKSSQSMSDIAADDEIDLRELFMVIWQGKWLIVLVTFLFAIGGIFFAKSRPNIYRAEVLISPSSGGESGGLAKLAGQFGGLASLAGINVGAASGSDKTGIALATLTSRKFVTDFIRNHSLEVPLMATKRWDHLTREIEIDREIFLDDKWVRDVKPGKPKKPTDWELYKTFSESLSVSKAKETGLITVSIEHQSPVLAKQWTMLLVEDINAWQRSDTIKEGKHSIDYLNQQLEKTSLASMKEVFHQLIEEQIKNLMLAEVNPDAAFKVVDPAVIPEEKAKPKRALIVVLATLLGGMLAVMIVLIRHFWMGNPKSMAKAP